MRRPVIAAVAVIAALVVVGGVLTAVVAYNGETSKLSQGTAPAVTADQITDYQRIVAGWPYPFAPGDAVPKSPPMAHPTVADDRTFVSFFYQCSWVNQLISGPASERTIALASLSAWNALPASVSTADNSDGAWKRSVLDPATNGDIAPLKTYFSSCRSYKKYRTKPGTGLIVDRPLPLPTSTAAPSQSTGATDAPAMIGQFTVVIPVDHGPRNYATGAVTLDADGHPASYVVALGDSAEYIAERFGFLDRGIEYLDTINQVRRGGYPFPLYAGDTLNLSAYTVLSVGTINGKVLNDPPPNPLPPQR